MKSSFARFLLFSLLLAAGAGYAMHRFGVSPQEAWLRIAKYIAPSTRPVATSAPKPAPSPTPASTPFPAPASVAAHTPAPPPDALSWIVDHRNYWPKQVLLLREARFPAFFNGTQVGSVEVPPGTAVGLASIDGASVAAVYSGGEARVPIAATDLPQRARLAMKQAASVANASTVGTPALLAPLAPAVEANLVPPMEDKESVLRNPFMGWVLYPCENGDIPNAERYWASQEANARVASTCYIRVLWSEMEPREGVYAWNADPNFKALLQGALDRHLRLAFRIYVTSQDVPVQATPEWAFQAGIRVASVDNRGKSPDVRDPVFQEKYGDFIREFGKAFDDPSKVNWVDAANLGWWGEMHHLDYLSNPSAREQVLRWLSNAYGSAFTRVPAAMCFPNATWTAAEMDRYCFSKGNFVMRRDGVAGPFGDVGRQQENAISERWPKMPFIVESFYQSPTAAQKRATLDQALHLHANFLDLRQSGNASDWTGNHPDWVGEFNLEGGYRFVVDSVDYPRQFLPGSTVTITSRIRNIGVGILPNNLKCWNWKYKLAYALVQPSADDPVATLVDTAPEDDPWRWRNGQPCNAAVTGNFGRVPSGQYDLGVAVVDTSNGNKVDIQLAITAPRTASGWYRWGAITVQHPAIATR